MVKKPGENAFYTHSNGRGEINDICSKDVGNPKEKPLNHRTLKGL
jgi:hypothetical protein